MYPLGLKFDISDNGIIIFSIIVTQAKKLSSIFLFKEDLESKYFENINLTKYFVNFKWKKVGSGAILLKVQLWLIVTFQFVKGSEIGEKDINIICLCCAALSVHKSD